MVVDNVTVASYSHTPSTLIFGGAYIVFRNRFL